MTKRARQLVWIVACAWGWLGCAPAPNGARFAHAPAPAGRPMLGSRADLHTPLGDYDGFRLEGSCRLADCFGIEGLGARVYPGTEDAHGLAGFEHFRDEILTALSGVRSLESSGFGVGCIRSGLILEMRDWRELDDAIARIGAFLRERALHEEVTICAWSTTTVDIGATR